MGMSADVRSVAEAISSRLAEVFQCTENIIFYTVGQLFGKDQRGAAERLVKDSLSAGRIEQEDSKVLPDCSHDNLFPMTTDDFP